MNAILDILMQDAAVWRGGDIAHIAQTLTSGFPGLDRLLPGGGWPKGALTELLLEHQGIGELRLILPAIGEITRTEGWVALVAPPYIPYAPALVSLGVDLNHLVVLEPRALKDQWWAAEQALRAGSCSAVVFWPSTIDERNLRRLQLAAQTGGAAGFVFTPAARAAQASPAPLRIRLSPAGSDLEVQILKRRGSLVETPLRLDVGSVRDSLVTGRTTEPIKPFPDVKPRSRAIPLRANKHYPNGADSKRIWDRAIAHSDEVKRSASQERR